MPEWLQSRKVVIILCAMGLTAIIAIAVSVALIVTGNSDQLPTIFRDTLLALTGQGAGGAASQAVPDTMSASKGTYRPSTGSHIPP